MTPDEAAAQAIQLFSQDARLCERHPNKIARKQVNVLSTKQNNGSKDVSVSNDHVPTNDILISETSENSKNNVKYHSCKYRKSAKYSDKHFYFRIYLKVEMEVFCSFLKKLDFLSVGYCRFYVYQTSKSIQRFLINKLVITSQIYL